MSLLVQTSKYRFLAMLCTALLHSAAVADTACPVTLTIDASSPGRQIPDDFLGLSVSALSIDGNSRYIRCFTLQNTQMVHLFRQIGVKHLRTIMEKAEPSKPDPSDSQIDEFFDFAAAAGVTKVIWSLHLMNTGEKTNLWSNNRAVAAHIWNTTTASGTVERNLLESFAFDNEPDWLRYIHGADPVVTGYSTPAGKGYSEKWEEWRQAIAAGGVAPGAKFSGPDTGSKWPCSGEVNTSVGGVPFTVRFATDHGSNLCMATQHFYGTWPRTNSALWMAEQCLSPDWFTNLYQVVEDNIVKHLTLPYRFTECSPFLNQKNPGNHCFATGLWAVDFFHWWALRGCLGVNPFTRCVQYNAPIYYDGANYVAVPYAYGMKAFALGSNGRTIPASKFHIRNPKNINLTAYGVVNATNLYVTVINKTFNATGSRTAALTIPAPAGFTAKHARYIVLSGGPAPGASGDATMRGACLGGAQIPNDGSAWAGTWTNLTVSRGGVSLSVLPATAVVIELRNR